MLLREKHIDSEAYCNELRNGQKSTVKYEGLKGRIMMEKGEINEISYYLLIKDLNDISNWDETS